MPELPFEKKKTPAHQDFKRLVAEGRTEEALQQMMAFTEAQGLTEWHNQLAVQSAKWGQYEQHQRAGTVSYDDLTRTQASISLALLDIINELPKEEPLPPGTRKLQGIREGRLKFQMLWTLLLGKMFFFGYLFTDMQAGTLPFKAFLLIAGVVLPIFASHLTVILQERLAARYAHRGSSNEKRVNRGVQYSIYLLLFLYIGGIFAVLESYHRGLIPRDVVSVEAPSAPEEVPLELVTLDTLPAPGEEQGLPERDSSGTTDKEQERLKKEIPLSQDNFQNLLLLLALIESSLGVYIGTLVHTLFKPKEA